MLDSGSALTVAQIVPDYELLRRIGRGAYGEVWLARSRATGVLRAAKIVWRRKFDDDRPFQREFEGIQRFERLSREHPSQLALFHIGRNEAEGYFYYVMELADNIGTATDYAPHTLRADLAHGRLPAAQVLEVAIALTEALDRLHRNGLVHRDVKPSNVIFVYGRSKLADIGLVTDASDNGSIVGTEGYLPPEGPGTPQADIFALGKVLYEAATGQGRREFPKLPPDLRAWDDATHVLELNEIFLKACASDAPSRYQRCEEIQSDLELLRRGESVRRKRTRQEWLRSFKNAGLAMAVVAFVATTFLFGMRQFAPSAYSSDGPPSTNAAATRLCEKGILVLRGDNTAELAEAYTNFHRAIDLDPRFARPYVGLLEFFARENDPKFRDATQEELRIIAAQLKKLAPNLAATPCAQAVVSWYDWNFPLALQCGRRAVTVDPRYELGHTAYAFMLCMSGHPVEAREQLEISLALAPSKATIYQVFGETYCVERDYAEAIKWERKALDLERHHANAFEIIATAQQATGNYSNAIENFELADIGKGAEVSASRKECDALREAFKEGGARGYWRERWRQSENSPNQDLYRKAVIQVYLGNPNAALGLLRKALDSHDLEKVLEDDSLNYMLMDECWDGLREDPRFKAVLDKIGITKVMPRRKK